MVTGGPTSKANRPHSVIKSSSGEIMCNHSMSLGPHDHCRLIFHYSIPNQHRLSIDNHTAYDEHHPSQKSNESTKTQAAGMPRRSGGIFSRVSRAPNLDLLGGRNT